MTQSKKYPNHVRFETSDPIHSDSDREEIELDDLTSYANQRKSDFLGRDETNLPLPQSGTALKMASY